MLYKTVLNTILSAAIVFAVAAAVLMPKLLRAEEQPEKTLSPYFFVKSGDAAVDSLPLKSTSVRATVAGVIADVTVTQRYTNEGKKPIEAIYVFPGSTNAAVHALTMSVGERVIKAKIAEKQKARESYERAKKEGKSASLLEQHRPNVFQMNVANILPGDEIKVELSYSELLIPSEGKYEFMYPTVVGPRYSNQPKSDAPPEDKFVESPYLPQGNKPTYSFELFLEIIGAMPLHEIISPSHRVSITYPDPNSADIMLPAGSEGDRDFVLNFSYEGGQIESGALLYQGMEENFFLVMLEPPARPAPDQIVPREYIFVVDISGSMHGFPLMVSKGLLVELIKRLRPEDKFNVLLFAGGQALLSEKSLAATSDNVQRAVALIDNQQAGGGTELLPALKQALTLPEEEGTSRSIVVITDGYVNVEREAFDLIRENLGRANLFSFGIGSSVNRYLIDGMARAGMGEATVVLNLLGSKQAVEKFNKYIESPVLTDIRVEYDARSIYDMEPLSVPDLFAEKPILLFGKWRGEKKGTITVSGKSAGGTFERNIDLSKLDADARLHGLKYLWARHKIASLSDYNRLQWRKEYQEQITYLGLKYNLLTEYTSFLAVDEVIRNKEQAQTVKQPLPLPKGVSNMAVNGFLATSPEPETYMMIALILTLLGAAVLPDRLRSAR
ncbi:MAG: VWA domain-containing protein [Deltaproteobacteria bacterium]|nr:VWA domain-containing protein [Deltaproteobacteria bacterium]